VEAGRYSEFAVLRDGEVDINFFYEPFLRSDRLIRLNIATGLAPFIDASPNHSALTVVRQREFCGDLGTASDVLEIDGTGVVNPTTASCASIGAGSAAVFAFDACAYSPTRPDVGRSSARRALHCPRRAVTSTSSLPRWIST
jgi:hypothetical protein